MGDFWDLFGNIDVDGQFTRIEDLKYACEKVSDA
jgi:hypothetical protein